MDIISFVIDGEQFHLSSKQIPEGCLLYKMMTTSVKVDRDDSGCYILNCYREDFIPIYEYLKNGKIPTCDELGCFDYFGIDLSSSYQLSSVVEEDMRANMYKNINNYSDNDYGLIKINENFWVNFQISKSNDMNLLFNSRNLTKNNWEDIQQRLVDLKKFTDNKGVFVAGGSIFSILFGLPINDIDLFLYGLTKDECFNAIDQISKLFEKREINADYLQKVDELINLLESIDLSLINTEILNIFRSIFNNGKNYETLKNKITRIFDYDHVKNDIRDFLKNDNSLADFWNECVKYFKTKLLDGSLDHTDFMDFVFILDNIYYGIISRQKHIQINNLLEDLIVTVTECTRTANAITFKNKDSEAQVILRSYQTFSEILHGFDVDSCCLGFDGNDIWMTQRAYFALKNGYNTVNFNRLSPSYELRLAKYGCRGMAIKINNFYVDNINKEVLSDYLVNIKDNKTTRFYLNHAHLSKLHNIDKLLYLEYYCERYNYKTHSIKMINKLNHEKSDYDAPSFIDYRKCSNGSGIFDLLSYFYGEYAECLEFNGDRDDDGPVELTENHYKELARTSNFLKSEVHNATKLLTNSIHNKFWFVKGELEYLNVIINIPDLVYDALKNQQPWDFPAKLQFKTTNPGEQMTNTFHQIILNDNNEWYKGKFYKLI